jgi:large subunit ribosomal protein L10
MASVAEIADRFRNSSGAVLTEYRGLTVKQLTELRRSLGGNASYAVVKNTLTKRAAAEAGVEGVDDLLVGPSAIAFITGDPVETAKGLRDFAKVHPLLVIKGGFLDGKLVTPEQIKKMADLESREVLLAKLAGAMKASLTNAVSLFNAPLAQTARVLGALQAKAEQDPSVLRGGAGSPAAASSADDSPADAAAPVAEVAPVAEAVVEETDTATEAPAAPDAAADVAEEAATETPVEAAEETPEG